MEMLKKQDEASVARSACTWDLAAHPALELRSLTLVIPGSCRNLPARLSVFGSLDCISSVKNQMSYSVNLKNDVGCRISLS